ncbi:MAG: hypothetical protein HC845_15630 [Akkermansiaceae bacterium]|nr:hypothetical protein [Akkermansiaceae bacterium]NJR41591.1 hypothetical protein [Akkermansiaceae bacterium]
MWKYKDFPYPAKECGACEGKTSWMAIDMKTVTLKQNENEPTASFASDDPIAAPAYGVRNDSVALV